MCRWNSNRPGRNRAGSRISTKLVVPTTKTSSSERKPSISVKSWLTIECSTPLPVYVPRALANESNSSKTMIDGADCRARWKIWRRFSSDSPTQRLLSSGPLTIVTAAPIAAAIALAKNVLPVRPPRVGGVVLALERAQESAQAHRVDAGHVLVKRPWVEGPAELAGLTLRDEITQSRLGDAEQARAEREKVFDDL